MAMGKYPASRLWQTLCWAVRRGHWKLVNALATELAGRKTRASRIADKYCMAEGK